MLVACWNHVVHEMMDGLDWSFKRLFSERVSECARFKTELDWIDWAKKLE